MLGQKCAGIHFGVLKPPTQNSWFSKKGKAPRNSNFWLRELAFKANNMCGTFFSSIWCPASPACRLHAQPCNTPSLQTSNLHHQSSATNIYNCGNSLLSLSRAVAREACQRDEKRKRERRWVCEGSQASSIRNGKVSGFGCKISHLRALHPS